MDSFEIQSRLKFISNVQIGDKINVKFMLIQKDCVSTKLSRTLYYENRITTLNFVRDNINRALEIITKSCCQQDKELTSNLIIDLKNSKIGIENLRQTYINDIKFCCDLNTVLQNIDIKIIECEKSFGYTFLIKTKETVQNEIGMKETGYKETVHKETTLKETDRETNETSHKSEIYEKSHSEKDIDSDQDFHTPKTPHFIHSPKCK
jgi:hypothetical protein